MTLLHFYILYLVLVTPKNVTVLEFAPEHPPEEQEANIFS